MVANGSPRLGERLKDFETLKVEEAKQDFDSEDFSPTVSLADISSEISLLDDLRDSNTFQGGTLTL